MQVIRNDKGEVTKVIITKKEYDKTSKDYKGEHDGKRSWMPRRVWHYVLTDRGTEI